MPPRRAVELRVGGQTYRVVATENDQHVQRLAELVDRKYAEIIPQGRGMTVQQAMFLIAMAFAEEAEEQRTRAAHLEAERDHALRQASRARDVVARLLDRVDGALEALPPDASKPAAPPPIVDPRPRSPLDPTADLADPSATFDPHATSDDVLLDLMPPSTRETTWNTASPPWAEASSPSTRQSQPREATHSVPRDTRQSLPRDARQSVPRDVRQSVPRDVRQSVPRDVRQSVPRDVRQSVPRDGGQSQPRERPPAAASPSSDTPASEAGVPRSPRPGLRLVRQSPSSSDDEPR